MQRAQKSKGPRNPPRDPSNPSPVFGRTFEKEVYTNDEVRALLAAAAGRSLSATRNRALIAVLWQGGLRIDEALELRPKDFNLETNQIYVRHGKNDKPRRVQVGPDAVKLSRAWIEKRSGLDIPLGAPLFCTLQGTKMYATYVRSMLQRIATKAGVDKRVHPHGFRHSFAVNLANNGMPVSHIQKLLGHDSLQTTSIYLSGISDRDVAETMKKVSWE